MCLIPAPLYEKKKGGASAGKYDDRLTKRGGFSSLQKDLRRYAPTARPNTLEWVAGSSCNGWPDDRGMPGRITWNTQYLNIKGQY
jgi:hypothetical protein